MLNIETTTIENGKWDSQSVKMPALLLLFEIERIRTSTSWFAWRDC
jgi:hypothetical protein